MVKRHIIGLFRRMYPALSIPRNMFTIRTSNPPLGPLGVINGIERIRSTVYAIALPNSQQLQKYAFVASSWDEVLYRLPVERMLPVLIVVDYHDHVKNIDYQQFYLKEI